MQEAMRPRSTQRAEHRTLLLPMHMLQHMTLPRGALGTNVAMSQASAWRDAIRTRSARQMQNAT